MHSTFSLCALSQRLLRPTRSSPLVQHSLSSSLTPFPASSSPVHLPQPIRLRRVVVQNRAKQGLFAGRHIQFGNSVSHSHAKTRRTWKPNVQHKWYYSELLQERFRVRVTTHAMKCIDKAGGFDDYLLFSPVRHLDEGFALEMRKRLEAVYWPIKNRMDREERWKSKALKLEAAAAPLKLDASTSTPTSVDRPERERVPVSSTAV